MDPPVVQVLEGARLPFRAKDLPEPPARLFLHGIVPRGPAVAIVGTRYPTEEARNYAEQIARWLAARGVAILSGGAKGIDGAAHRGAIAGAGGTLVVAPSSFDRPYPAEHASLFADVIAAGGGHLSRFEHGVDAMPPYFFQRNALLVALCHALVLVEAPLRSGARNAAKWARRLGRPCFVVPSAPWNERGQGCIAELQLGAAALAGPEDVLRFLEDRRLYAVAFDSGRGGEAEAGGDRPAPGAGQVSASEASRAGEARAPAATQESRASERQAPRLLPERHVAVARGKRKPRGEGTDTARGKRPVAEAEAARRRRPPGDELDASLAAALLEAIAAGACYVEQIAAAVGADPLQVNHALLLLMLRGEIERGPCGDVTIPGR